MVVEGIGSNKYKKISITFFLDTYTIAPHQCCTGALSFLNYLYLYNKRTHRTRWLIIKDKYNKKYILPVAVKLLPCPDIQKQTSRYMIYKVFCQYWHIIIYFNILVYKFWSGGEGQMWQSYNQNTFVFSHSFVQITKIPKFCILQKLPICGFKTDLV